MAGNFLRGMERPNMERWMLYCFVIALSLYVALDKQYSCGCSRKNPLLKASGRDDPDICATRDGHHETTSMSSSNGEENPWKQMKWTGEAAACKVKGHLIEKLDDANDLRRGFALKFTDDVEDKTHLLPWLLASKTNELALRRRRVYIDLGAKSFNSSVEWFLRMYPLDFTEVYAFEVDSRQWQPPPNDFNEDENFLPSVESVPVRVRSTPSIPHWMMDRLKVYFLMVSDYDDASENAIDISRFIKEEVRLTADDTVVVKMDIEGAEWPILRKWMEDPLMPRIIDELFVEVHYASPTMTLFGWNAFGTHSREKATRLLADLRWRGFYAHFWP